MAAPNHILVPLDLSPLGETKLPTAEEYARALGADVLLLHVLPAGLSTLITDRRLPARRVATIEAGQDVSPEETRARTYLDAIASRLRAAGIVARALVRGGPVAATILAVAREERARLIIIGSDVREGLSQMLPGGIAEAIIRGAPCPVLLIRPEPEAGTTPPSVRSFAEDATRAGLVAPRTLGLRPVDVARIIGSIGRSGELGEDFRPLRPKLAEQQRYDRVVAAASQGTPLPPIELYKLGYGYYVVDGHRRVAAAKQLGQSEIAASVTEFVPANDPSAQRLFAARRTFEGATGLTRVGASLPETYDRMRDTIGDFAARHDLPDLREAAELWYAREYRPLIGRIRSLRLHQSFPGARSADVLVQLLDHRRAEAVRQGREPSWDEALRSFAAAPRIGNAAT